MVEGEAGAGQLFVEKESYLSDIEIELEYGAVLERLRTELEMGEDVVEGMGSAKGKVKML